MSPMLPYNYERNLVTPAMSSKRIPLMQSEARSRKKEEISSDDDLISDISENHQLDPQMAEFSLKSSEKDNKISPKAEFQFGLKEQIGNHPTLMTNAQNV